MQQYTFPRLITHITAALQLLQHPSLQRYMWNVINAQFLRDFFSYFWTYFSHLDKASLGVSIERKKLSVVYRLTLMLEV